MIRLRTDFHKNVKRYREGLGYTQQKAAAQLRMPQQTYDTVESGSMRNPTLRTLLRVVNGLDMELSEVFENYTMLSKGKK